MQPRDDLKRWKAVHTGAGGGGDTPTFRGIPSYRLTPMPTEVPTFAAKKKTKKTPHNCMFSVFLHVSRVEPSPLSALNLSDSIETKLGLASHHSLPPYEEVKCAAQD